MEITRFLFKNSFSTIESLLMELQSDLKDHNVSPIFLYRHYGHASRISRILRCLIPRYAAVIQTNFDTDIRGSYYDLSPYTNLPQPEDRLYRDTSIVFDEEGLVELTETFSLEKDSLLFDQKYVMYYSPFFRRYFSSDFTEITQLIAQISKRAKVKVSLDHFRLQRRDTHPPCMLAEDHWRGEKFAQGKLNDEHYEAVVVYGREDEDCDEETKMRTPWPIIRTEFRIRNREPGVKQVEIEEMTLGSTLADIEKINT